MIAGLVGAGVALTGGAIAYRGRAAPPADPDEEPEVVDAEDEAPPPKNDVAGEEPASQTWKESAGRTEGRDGYVFGDLTRGIVVRHFSSAKAEENDKEGITGSACAAKTEDETAEATGDAQHTQVQRLVREAVKLYRARGYKGTINMSQTVAYFGESVSVSVDGPPDGVAPWETTAGGAEKAAADAAEKMAKEGQAGVIFGTLLARLERRAKSWQALAGDENLDPNLTQSAQIGFAIPVVKLGWGVSVSLTVNASSLLKWAEHGVCLAPATDAAVPAT